MKCLALIHCVHLFLRVHTRFSLPASSFILFIFVVLTIMYCVTSFLLHSIENCVLRFHSFHSKILDWHRKQRLIFTIVLFFYCAVISIKVSDFIVMFHIPIRISWRVQICSFVLWQNIDNYVKKTWTFPNDSRFCLIFFLFFFFFSSLELNYDRYIGSLEIPTDRRYIRVLNSPVDMRHTRYVDIKCMFAIILKLGHRICYVIWIDLNICATMCMLILLVSTWPLVIVTCKWIVFVWVLVENSLNHGDRSNRWIVSTVNI